MQIVKQDCNITPLILSNAGNEPVKKIEPHESKISSRLAKPLHGKYPQQLEAEHVRKEASIGRIKSGNLFSETEGFIAAIHDQVILTKNYKKLILKEQGIIDSC